MKIELKGGKKMLSRTQAIKKIVEKGLTKEELKVYIELTKKILQAKPKANSEVSKAIKNIQALPIDDKQKQALIEQVRKQYNIVDEPENYKKASWVLSQLSVLVKALEGGE